MPSEIHSINLPFQKVSLELSTHIPIWCLFGPALAILCSALNNPSTHSCYKENSGFGYTFSSDFIYKNMRENMYIVDTSFVNSFWISFLITGCHDYIV